MSQQVMLSYCSQDTGATHLGGDGTVLRLQKALEARGYSVFLGEAGGDASLTAHACRELQTWIVNTREMQLF